MEVLDGVLDLTPHPPEPQKPEPRPGAETVAYQLGILNERQLGNPFHGLRARPGQFIHFFPKDGDTPAYRKDMFQVINSYLHGQPVRTIESNKYKFAEQE